MTSVLASLLSLSKTLTYDIMKSLHLLFAILIALNCFVARGAQPLTTAAGHWEGNINLPTAPLGILVDLESTNSALSGTIDIPTQSLRGFKLGDVSGKGAAISFAMPGIPGDPKFSGKLAADGNAIAGDFTQGGQTFPFKIERKPKPAPTADETPAKGIPGTGLAGRWQGTLKPAPTVELRLALEITSSATAGFSGTMISVDQGASRMPVRIISEKSGAVHLEVSNVGGTFDGKLNADGSEISGDWKQGGNPMPLVFKRLPKAK